MNLFGNFFNRGDEDKQANKALKHFDATDYETADDVFDNLYETLPELSNDERMSLRNSEAKTKVIQDELDFDMDYNTDHDYDHDEREETNEGVYDYNRRHVNAVARTHKDVGYNNTNTYPDPDGIYNTNGIIQNDQTNAVYDSIDQVAQLKTEAQFGDNFDVDKEDNLKRVKAYNHNYLETINDIATHYENVAKHSHDDEIDAKATDNEQIPTEGPIAVSAQFNQRDENARTYRNWDGSFTEYPSYIRNEGLAKAELRKEYAEYAPDINPQIRIDNVRDGYGTMAATFIFDNKDEYDQWNAYANAGDDSMNTVRDINKIDQSEFERLNDEPNLDLKNGLSDLSNDKQL